MGRLWRNKSFQPELIELAQFGLAKFGDDQQFIRNVLVELYRNDDCRDIAAPALMEWLSQLKGSNLWADVYFLLAMDPTDRRKLDLTRLATTWLSTDSTQEMEARLGFAKRTFA